MLQDGRRFRRSFVGYNRADVDAEFGRLLARSDESEAEKQSLQTKVDSLSQERSAFGREQIQLNTQISAMTSQVVELEHNLSRAKSDNDTLSQAIEAHKSEKNAMQIRFDQLRERDRDYSLREREFSELQSSVASIMSVTKRATDRVFQQVVDNQERITQIAGDAAREVAAIRADMSQVREQLNAALDEVQDRIDRVDASLTGAVHKLVAIKHDDGLQVGDRRPDVLSEVERLLSMRSGDVDTSDGKSYTVPVLGPYSAKFITDTAQRVNDGRLTARSPLRDDNNTNSGAQVDVRRVSPTQFESSDESILEASKLLERGGVTAEEFYDRNLQFYSPAHTDTPQPEDVEVSPPIQIGFAPSAPASPPPSTEPFSSPDSYTQADGMRIGDNVAAVPGGASYEAYPVKSYCFQPYDQVELPEQPSELLVSPKTTVSVRRRRPSAGKKKVGVRAVKGRVRR